MSEPFRGYERQYCELSTLLTRKNAAAVLLTGEQKKQKVQELKSGVDEAETLIRRMDLEARSLPATQKAALLGKLREYKTDLNNLKREVKKVSSIDSAAERDELMESGLGAELTNSADQRARLLTNTARLEQSSEKIRDGKRALLETEELGVSILQDLHQQRQTLLHARDTLHGVDDGIGKSRQILNNMARRMSRNKWIMGGILGTLVIAIVVVVYVRLRSHSS